MDGILLLLGMGIYSLGLKIHLFTLCVKFEGNILWASRLQTTSSTDLLVEMFVPDFAALLEICIHFYKKTYQGFATFLHGLQKGGKKGRNSWHDQFGFH